MTFIHRYTTVDGAYHAIQTDPSVHDGHLVAVPDRHEVAIVCGAQPMAVDAVSRAFPALSDPEAWRRFGQGRYRDVAMLADCLGAAWALEPGDIPTATGAGTFRAVYNRIQ